MTQSNNYSRVAGALSVARDTQFVAGKPMQQVSDWLVALYRSAAELSVRDFKQFAMRQLCGLITGQSGIWVTRYNGDFVNLDESPLYNLPSESFSVYQQAYPNPFEHDPVLAAAAANMGQSQILYELVRPEQWRLTDMYRNFCIPYDIEHVLCIVRPTELHQVVHIFSLYRGKSAQCFSKDDKAMLDFLMPMLAEAHRQNLLSSIGRGSGRHLSIAVCTRDGRLLESDRTFLELTDIQPGQKVFHGLNDSDRQKKVIVNGHEINMSLDGELWHCSINIEMKELTARENEIAQAVRSGMSDKEIAHKLDISTRTVGNILQKIYRKLDISNRYQLIVKLLQE